MTEYEIVNPILRGMYPDPSWIWDERRQAAVLVNSTFDLVPGLPLHASSDLASWTHIGDAVDEDLARRLFLPFVADSGGLYAPTLRKIGDKYAIACTVARLDRPQALAAGVSAEALAACESSAGNFVIEADQLEGPWRGPYWVKGADLIDPDLFEDADGTVFWTQTRPAPAPQWEGQTEVWTCQIDPVSWQLVGRPAVLWRGFGKGAVWAEGPHLYRLGDYVYLWTAEGGTSFDHSEMVMRVAAPQGLKAVLDEAVLDKDVLDETAQATAAGDPADLSGCRGLSGCLDLSDRLFRANKKNPVLTHRHLGLAEPVQCVGHTDLLRHPRLGWWLVCLGVRETRVTGSDIAVCSFLGRESFLAPVSWEKDPAAWAISTAAAGTDCETGFEAGPTAAVPADPGWPVVTPGLGRLPVRVQVGDQGLACQVGPESAGRAVDDGLEHQVGQDHDFVRVAQGLLPGSAEAAWRYLRLSSDLCLIEVSGDRLSLRQDSLNRLSLSRLDTGQLRLSLLRGGVAEESVLPVSPAGSGQGPVGRLALFIRRGFAEVVQRPAAVGVPGLTGTEAPGTSSASGNPSVRVWSGRPAEDWRAASRVLTPPIDVTYLSTEKSGGFVGCLIGV